jgi:hypothetical protein
MQFTTDISDEVISYIHSMHNRTVHSHGHSFCRSTRFASFLRESATLSVKNQEATAITLCFCSGQQKLLTVHLVDRLVHRFEDYFAVVLGMTTDTDTKKCAALEFLTNRFLLLEQQVKLSRRFELPKTRTVLRSVNQRFMKVCQTMKWEIPRAI